MLICKTAIQLFERGREPRLINNAQKELRSKGKITIIKENIETDLGIKRKKS